MRREWPDDELAAGRLDPKSFIAFLSADHVLLLFTIHNHRRVDELHINVQHALMHKDSLRFL